MKETFLSDVRYCGEDSCEFEGWVDVAFEDVKGEVVGAREGPDR